MSNKSTLYKWDNSYYLSLSQYDETYVVDDRETEKDSDK